MGTYKVNYGKFPLPVATEPLVVHYQHHTYQISNATSKGSGEPAHLCILTRAFTGCMLKECPLPVERSPLVVHYQHHTSRSQTVQKVYASADHGTYLK